MSKKSRDFDLEERLTDSVFQGIDHRAQCATSSESTWRCCFDFAWTLCGECCKGMVDYNQGSALAGRIVYGTDLILD